MMYYDFDPGWVLLDSGGHRRSQGVSCSVGFGAVVRHEKITCQLGVMHVCPKEDLTSKLECFSGT